MQKVTFARPAGKHRIKYERSNTADGRKPATCDQHHRQRVLQASYRRHQTNGSTLYRRIGPTFHEWTEKVERVAVANTWINVEKLQIFQKRLARPANAYIDGLPANQKYPLEH